MSTWSYPEPSPYGDPGTVNEMVRITLSSGGTSGFGVYRGTWVADDGSFSCSWGSAITMTKNRHPLMVEAAEAASSTQQRPNSVGST